LQTLEELRRLRYVGDESFARDWARSRADDRGYGPRRIEQELRAKGIADAIIIEAVRDIFGGNDESKRARRALEKQFRRARLDDPRLLRRAAAFLQRRGFSETVIQNLLQLNEDL
jgi:regulatory protein